MTDMEQVRKPSKVLRILKRIVLGLLVLVLVLVVTALAVANSQDGSVKLLQSFLYWQRGDQPNSFSPRKPPADMVRPDGVRIRTNVRYGRRYPNSFLDIWSVTANGDERRPTVIYMHGGGFFMGSKDWGDPFAAGGEQGALDEPIEIMAKRGFNVVNLDYALSPAYRYPVPVRQLNEAIGYLRANSDRLGLDMTRLFVMGGSAGAQISAQYGVLLSDPAYAAEVGIRPAIAASDVKGLVLFSPPLKVSGFGWRMNAMMWAYLDTKDLDNSRQARQVDVLAHLNARYPPTYITDGNQPDTFPEHAKAMDRILEAKGVDHVFNFYPASLARLDHGYTGRLDTKYGRQNLERAIAFMQQRASAAGPAPAGPRSENTSKQ